jgi:hypothetical protein
MIPPSAALHVKLFINRCTVKDGNTVTLSLNGQEIDRRQFTSEGVYAYTVPVPDLGRNGGIVSIETDKDFRPSEVFNSGDNRTLGVALSQLNPLKLYPSYDIGFSQQQETAQQLAGSNFDIPSTFRWARARSLLTWGSDTPPPKTLFLRASNSDIESNPLEVRIYTPDGLFVEVILNNTHWKRIEAPKLQSCGYLVLITSRSWISKEKDSGERGIAVAVWH